jgi:integrase
MATIVKGKNPRKPYTVRYQDAGKQRERSFTTAKEANDFKAKFEHDSRASIFIDPKLGQTEFVAYAEAWISNLDVKHNTRANYQSILRAHLRNALAGRSLASVAADRDGIWQLVTSLPVGAGRRSTALIVVTGAIEAAKRAGKISAHNLDGLSIETNPVQAAEIIPATAKQIGTLRAELLPADQLIIDLMYGLGLRIGEALAVSLMGFSKDGKRLRIHEQILTNGTTGPLKSRKAGEHRDVPVPAWVWAKVQAHVKAHGTRDGGYLFGRNGKHLVYGNVRYAFARGAKLAGIADKRGKVATPHHLRHLYVSALLDAGVPITNVADFVGHRDVKVTHRIYGHLLPSAWERATDALESLAA